MKYRTRIYYTEEQKTLMWDRWQRGESLTSIATGADVVGARGNIARCDGRLLDPFDCPTAASRTVDGQSRVRSGGTAAGSDTVPIGPIKRPGSGRTVGVVTLPEVHIDISVQVHHFRTGTLFVEKGERLEQSQIVTASANLESGGFLGVSPGPGSAVLVFLHQMGPEGLPVHHGPNYIRSRNGRTTDVVISTEGRGLRPHSWQVPRTSAFGLLQQKLGGAGRSHRGRAEGDSGD